MNNALKIVNAMYSQDAFSQWLGIEIIEVSKGNCQLKMLVKKEMLNGFKICHGGIAYSLADSAFAFAANTHGNKSLSLETSISTSPCDIFLPICSSSHKLVIVNCSAFIILA